MTTWTSYHDPKLTHRTYRRTFEPPLAPRWRAYIDAPVDGAEVFYDPFERLWTGFLTSGPEHYQAAPAQYGMTRQEVQEYLDSEANGER